MKLCSAGIEGEKVLNRYRDRCCSFSGPLNECKCHVNAYARTVTRTVTVARYAACLARCAAH